MKYIFAAAAIAAMTAGAAQARTVSFNFGCGNGVTCDSASSSNQNHLPSSFSLTNDGLTVEASAGYYRYGVSFRDNAITHSDARTDGSQIGRYVGGAGVFNASDNDHTVDGNNNFNDFIELRFSEAVQLSSISLGFVNPGSSFYYFADTVGNDGDILNGDFISDRTATGVTGYRRGTSTISGLADVTSTVFRIAAFGQSDSFKLSSVSVNTVAAVPLPAAGILLIAGLGGLGAISRRKRKAA